VIKSIIKKLHGDRNLRFWFFQLIGWSGYSIGTFLTITLIDGDVSWVHVGHIALSALLGIAATWPLRQLYRYTFQYSLGVRIFVAATAVIIFSAIWTVLRVLVFAWVVDEPPLWNEVNYWYFGSLFVFLSWTVLYYGIKYYDLLTAEHQKLLEESAQKRTERLLRYEAEAAAHDARIRMLHYQLAPHFLFNTLNAINALVRLGETKRAQEMIQLLGDFLRHALEQDTVESVSLEQEIDSLMLYLNIEKARFEDRLSLELDIDPASRDAEVPALLLQPIVENAMKYAISECEDGGTLSIRSIVKKGQLCLQVADTGPGLDSGSAEEGQGVGLRNVRERLQTLYGDRYQFELSGNEPTGLQVTICLPLQQSYTETGADGMRGRNVARA